MTTRRDHAVVIGASMGGLLTARVLSDHYARVTVLERDALPVPWVNRRGVPQGWHPHALLPRGRRTLERLFPGFTDAMREAGAPVYQNLRDLRFEAVGHLLCRADHELPEPVVQASRPYVESWVRERVVGRANIVLRDHTPVVAPLHSDGRITGVRIGTGSGDTDLRADLVVDTSGRAARTPVWLGELGYGRPPEDELTVRVTYVTQRLRLRSGSGLEPLILYGMRPGRPQGMALFHYEHDTWLFTVTGIADAAVATDRDAMLAAIRPWAPADVHDAVADALPLDDPVAFRYPASRRRHYERMRRFPRGLLVLGDAVCSVNPLYGQGMSLAAAEADALDRLLAEPDDRDDALARRFFRAISPTVDAAWQLSTGADLALPEVEGRRPLPVRVVNAWVDRVLAAAGVDADVARTFLQVSGLIDPPARLFHPGLVATVVRRNRGRRGTPAAAAHSPGRTGSSTGSSQKIKPHGLQPSETGSSSSRTATST